MKFFSTHFRLFFSATLLVALWMYLNPELLAAGLGQTPGGVPGATINSGGSPQGAVTAFGMLLQRVADGLAALAATVAILFVVVNGAKITFSFGNSEEIANARKGLMWAAIGLLLIIFAYIVTKSVIALTYSGADGSSTIGTEMINAPGNPTLEPVPGSPNPKGECKGSGVLPPICYGRYDLENNETTADDEAVCNAEAIAALAGVCQDFGVANCTLLNLQGAIDYTKLNVPTVCHTPDGKYGHCTRSALQELYRTQCIK